MDIIDQLYNSHVSAATLDTLDKYRIHKDQALHGYHVLKEHLTHHLHSKTEAVSEILLQLVCQKIKVLIHDLIQSGRLIFCELFGKDV